MLDIKGAYIFRNLKGKVWQYYSHSRGNIPYKCGMTYIHSATVVDCRSFYPTILFKQRKSNRNRCLFFCFYRTSPFIRNAIADQLFIWKQKGKVSKISYFHGSYHFWYIKISFPKSTYKMKLQ